MTDLLACPMKDGLLCCAGTPRIVAECRCTACYRWADIFNNPRDAFLSRLISTGVRA